MTTATSVSATEPGISAMRFARSATLKFLEGLTDEQLMHRPTPEANHATWILGHLAYVDDSIYTKVSGHDSVIPSNYKALFDSGTTPSDNASDYPSKDELLTNLEKAHTAFIGWFESLSDEQMASAPPEGLEIFGANFACVVATLAWHEGVHNGQLIEIRRTLGLPRAFG
ncbi:MAG: DinB family protein [Planctomycetota bacterium]|nr:DinB family protein [Planctomycetota bacterium]